MSNGWNAMRRGGATARPSGTAGRAKLSSCSAASRRPSAAGAVPGLGARVARPGRGALTSGA